MLILGCAVRFIHFALFEGTLLSLQFYAVDTIGLPDRRVFSASGRPGSRQMTTQYRWINGRAGFLRWARHGAANSGKGR